MMMIWIVAALVGGLLSIAGFMTLLHRCRRGEIRRRYLLAASVGYVSFVSFAILSVLWPNAVGGVVTLAMLLPAFVAIIVIVSEHERSDTTDRSAN